MFRNSLIAVALLAASTGVLADYDDDGHVYGRVVTVEPNFVISFSGGRYPDGFRVLYEVGGRQYWTRSHYRPEHVIWVPRPVGYYGYPVRYYDHDGWRRGHWKRHDRDDDHGDYDRR